MKLTKQAQFDKTKVINILESQQANSRLLNDVQFATTKLANLADELEIFSEISEINSILTQIDSTVSRLKDRFSLREGGDCEEEDGSDN